MNSERTKIKKLNIIKMMNNIHSKMAETSQLTDSDSDTNSDISYISEGEEVLYDANRIFNDNLNSDRIEWCNMHNITMQQMDDMRLVNPDFSISTFFVLLPDAIHDLFFIHLEYFETGYWRH